MDETPDLGVIVDPLVRVFDAVVQSHRIRRVPLEELRRSFAKHDPTGATSSNSRQRMADALEVLVTRGTVTLPKLNRLYETHAAPRLPMWVERVAARRQKVVLPTRTWRPELAAAAREATTVGDFDVLNAVDGFLREGGAERPVVPHRERSLELFGDEKRLDALLRMKMFTNKLLTLDLLRCYQAPLPFAMQHVGTWSHSSDLLIVENHATYASALSAARSRARVGDRGVGIGWGAGNQLPTAVDGLTQLDPFPARIWYFGDLDLDGLRIAGRAANAVRKLGLPNLRPALPLYRELINRGVSQHAARACDEETAWVATEWLSEPSARRSAAAVLVRGERLAQEAVGFEVFSQLARWW